MSAVILLSGSSYWKHDLYHIYSHILFYRGSSICVICNYVMQNALGFIIELDSSWVPFFAEDTPLSWSQNITFQCNNPTIPKMSFMALIHPHRCSMIQQLTTNFPHTLITTRVYNRYPFPSQALIAPPVKKPMLLFLVYRGSK